MKKVWFLASFFIIVLLGITSVICAKGVAESLFSRHIDAWLSDQPKIFTSQLTNEQKENLISALKERVDEQRFMVVSQTHKPLQSGAILYTSSVLCPSDGGNVSINPLVFLDTPVIDQALLQSVASAKPDSYAGYGNDVSSRVADLPSIRSGLYLRVDKLNAADKLDDACSFVGLSDSEFKNLVNDLSSDIGVSAEKLTTKMSGSSSVFGLLYLFCAGAFGVLSLILCLLLITHTLLELKTLAIHMMLGWSKTDFVCELLSKQALQILVLMPIAAFGAFAIFDGFTVHAAFVGFALASVLPAVLASLISMVLAAMPLLWIKPVDAIHGRYSRQGFYALTLSVYVICLVSIFAGCLYIDQPLALYTNLARTRTAWNTYEGWRVIQDFGLGEDRFTGNPMKLSQDLYAWYAKHEHDEGVYLAKSRYYNETAIQTNTSGEASLKPFWYLAASPSYLKKIGMPVSDELIQKAEMGTRVHLLPKSLNTSEIKTMQNLLIASRKSFDSNIVTAFMKNPTYEFASYDDSKELFTWNTNSELPAASSGFVIAIVTANNMVPFESESLVASGLENSYIKLDEQAASRLLNERGSVSLGGSVSARFATVGNYIDGIQKTLKDLFMLFSVVLAVLLATAVIMIVCLVDVVNRVNAREMSVKYTLGFGTWELYRREVLFVTLTTLVGVCVSLFFRCNAGILIGSALLVISNLVIGIASRVMSAAVVLETVSKE